MGVGLEALGDEFQCVVVVTAVDELVDHAGHLAVIEKDRRRVRIDERGASGSVAAATKAQPAATSAGRTKESIRSLGGICEPDAGKLKKARKSGFGRHFSGRSRHETVKLRRL